MKNMFKRIMLLSIASLVALNVGTIEPASPSSIASRLKVTGQQWMNALQQYSPNMTPQQKQRLITLTKRTAKLIAVFLVVLGLYAIGKPSREGAEGIPDTSPGLEAVLEREADEVVEVDEPAPTGRERVAEFLRSVRPETKTPTLHEMMEKQKRAREEETTGRKRAHSQ